LSVVGYAYGEMNKEKHLSIFRSQKIAKTKEYNLSVLMTKLFITDSMSRLPN